MQAARVGCAAPLVIGEIALTTVSLSTAGLCLRSFVNSSRADIGLTAEHVSTLELQLPVSQYRQPEKRDAFVASAIERLGRLPGVTAVEAGTLPLVNIFPASFAI